MSKIIAAIVKKTWTILKFSKMVFELRKLTFQGRQLRNHRKHSQMLLKRQKPSLQFLEVLICSYTIYIYYYICHLCK